MNFKNYPLICAIVLCTVSCTTTPMLRSCVAKKKFVRNMFFIREHEIHDEVRYKVFRTLEEKSKNDWCAIVDDHTNFTQIYLPKEELKYIPEHIVVSADLVHYKYSDSRTEITTYCRWDDDSDQPDHSYRTFIPFQDTGNACDEYVKKFSYEILKNFYDLEHRTLTDNPKRYIYRYMQQISSEERLRQAKCVEGLIAELVKTVTQK